MWQFVFVAAVAGSGILAKHLFRKDERGEDHPDPVRVSSVSEQNKDQTTVVEKEENVKPDSLGVSSNCIADSWMSQKLHPVVEEDKGTNCSNIFRFTSSLDRSEISGSRSANVDNSVKRTSTTSRGEKKKLMLEEDQRNKGRRNVVSFCLKKSRTGKIAFRKCGSCKQSKGNSSLFSCGVGFGFMLSAGKAEFNKLTVDIEETTEVISNLQDSSCKDRANIETISKNKEPLLMTDFNAKLASPDDPEVLHLSSNGDSECASSILTGEVDLEALEMDRLEAELESELQKIPNEDDPEYFMDFPSTELSAYALEGPQKPLGMDANSSQLYGVSPIELDRKLCHVLIKQQESQIAELESNLYLSQMKLHDKDAELRKLKAVVCSLRDFSLETAPDDEAEDGVVLDEVGKEEKEKEKEMRSNADSLIYPRSVDDGSNKIIVAKEQKSFCGVKRLMEFESYANYQVNHNALVS